MSLPPLPIQTLHGVMDKGEIVFDRAGYQKIACTAKALLGERARTPSRAFQLSIEGRVCLLELLCNKATKVVTAYVLSSNDSNRKCVMKLDLSAYAT